MIKKLIEKLFTLTAFISAVCLAVHYAPTSIIFVGNRLDFIADTPLVLIAFLLSLMMLASAILLGLEDFRGDWSCSDFAYSLVWVNLVRI